MCDLRPMARITLKSSQEFTCICSISQKSWEYYEVLKENVAAKIIYYKFVIFTFVTFSLSSFVFKYLTFISILLLLLHNFPFFVSYQFFPENFFTQLNHLTLLDCFPKLLCIIFNQTVCFQISYNVWKCLLLSFILFFSQFLCIWL